MHLEISSVNSQTEIEGVSPQLATAEATLGANFTNIEVQELPLNGGNWAHLTALVPGAVDTGSGDQRSIRFAGHVLDDNNFTFDGVDASGVLNQAQKQYVRLAIPLDSINEFQVRTQNFNADTGETGGGQIAVTSLSARIRFMARHSTFFATMSSTPVHRLTVILPLHSS